MSPERTVDASQPGWWRWYLAGWTGTSESARQLEDYLCLEGILADEIQHLLAAECQQDVPGVVGQVERITRSNVSSPRGVIREVSESHAREPVQATDHDNPARHEGTPGVR